MTTQPAIRLARSFWQRFKGLMFSARLLAGQALLIPRCSSVHTLFMRYPLDLVYLDRNGQVVKLVHGLRPWRVSWGGQTAAHTVEMAAGGITYCGLALGSRLTLPMELEEAHASP